MLPDDVLRKVVLTGHQVRVRGLHYVGRVNVGDQRHCMMLLWSDFYLDTEVALKNKLQSIIWENRLVNRGPYEVLLCKILRPDGSTVYRTHPVDPKEDPFRYVIVNGRGNLQYSPNYLETVPDCVAKKDERTRLDECVQLASNFFFPHSNHQKG